VPIHIALVVISAVLAIQSAVTVYLMLYGWNRGSSRGERASVPNIAASHRFSILLPARHESDVIAHTIERIAAIDYPADYFELLVVCEAGDAQTIAAAVAAFQGQPNLDAVMVTFDDGPISKPHGLNKGLASARFDTIMVVDAEDDVHPEILQAANAVLVHTKADIVQGPVQLVDHGSRWFSQLNCLEYFFWFRSRMIFHALSNVIPLAGNTVFFRRRVLDMLGGWDESCLREDADVGIRASALGAKTAVIAEPDLATREETPSTVDGLLRQRTRWHQGFLQILRKGDWLSLPGVRRRSIAAATLSFPLFAALVTLLWPMALLGYLLLDVPVWMAMFAALPFYGLLAQLAFSLYGLLEMRGQFEMRVGPKQVLWFVLGYIPFQWLIGWSALRAIGRELRGVANWEKTAHTGTHRVPAAPQPASQPAVAAPAMSATAVPNPAPAAPTAAPATTSRPAFGPASPVASRPVANGLKRARTA
jgi:cellulose synthase/poly-beta-1,6-N-acetylglucosamine synthase-like glycosyltransferase